jgi:septal ring factor EnvC (AmiA/AmiB activator)
MRTSLIISLVISVLINLLLLGLAYSVDNTAQNWKAKYFDAAQKANEQSNHANQYALEKSRLLDQLKEIETRTAEINKVLEDTRKELDAMSKKYNDKAKELEIANQISSLPFSCPSIVQPPKKKIVKRKKRIPYDIAPSQQ